MSRILLQQAFISLRSAARGDGNYQDYSDVADALEAELAKPEQTETLRVADAIELNVASKTDRLFAAKELRRLHDENDTLKKCLFQMQNAAIELAKPEERVCCGDYEKCWKACTPRGRWLAEKELVKPEQTKYSDIVSDGGLDPRNKFDAQPEQEPKLTDAGADTNITWGLEAKGSGMVTLNQAGMRVDFKYAPPRKEWVGLTDEEEIELDEKYGDDFNAYIDARDAKLKELNK